MKRIKVSSKGQITLPSSVRDAMNISFGDVLTVDLKDNEIILQVPKYKSFKEFADSIKPTPYFVTDKDIKQARESHFKKRYERSLSGH